MSYEFIINNIMIKYKIIIVLNEIEFYVQGKVFNEKSIKIKANLFFIINFIININFTISLSIVSIVSIL